MVLLFSSAVLMPNNLTGSGSGQSIFPSPGPESGSGSGSGITPMDTILTCSSDLSYSVEVYDTIGELLQLLSCRTDTPQQTILYFLTIPSLSEDIYDSQDISNMLISQLFSLGETAASIMVCVQGSDGDCINDLVVVNITVGVSFQDNAVPYGPVVSDSEFRGVLDGAVPVYPPRNIPFFSNYYKRIYVSRLFAVMCVSAK